MRRTWQQLDHRRVNPSSVFSTLLIQHEMERALREVQSRRLMTFPPSDGGRVLRTGIVWAPRLLDVGCGDRPYRNLIAADQYVGLDVSADGDLIGFADALPFADQSFDVVLATEVIEHLPDAYKGVHEMARVLRRAGVLILSVPFVHELHEQPYDFFRPTIYGVRALLEPFEIIAERAVGGRGAVFADLAIRGTDRQIARALRTVRLARIRAPLTSPPQRLAARLAARTGGKIAGDGGPGLTLGYVVAAVRR